MTKKELLEALASFDENLEICISSPVPLDGGELIPIEGAFQVNADCIQLHT